MAAYTSTSKYSAYKAVSDDANAAKELLLNKKLVYGEPAVVPFYYPNKDSSAKWVELMEGIGSIDGNPLFISNVLDERVILDDAKVTPPDSSELRPIKDVLAEYKNTTIVKDDQSGRTTFTQGTNSTEITSEYIFNINAYHKAYTTPYKNKEDARDDVPFAYRKLGLMITYLFPNESTWVVEQYVVPAPGFDMHYQNWTGESHWTAVGSSVSPEPIVYPGDLSSVFSAIRSLQTEVAKMRNAFNYGMYSYTGTATAMSGVMEDLSNIDDNEPLWSIEEEDLSPIANASVEFNSNCSLVPLTYITFDAAGTYGIIDGTVTWLDTVLSVRNTADPKVMVYLTVSNKNDIIILEDLDDLSKNVTIDLSYFNLQESNRYNVLLVLSRTVTFDDEIYGKNFVWMSISGYNTDEIIGEGYVGINDNYQCDYMFHQDVQEINPRLSVYSIILSDQTLYKLNFYSKYQDFSHEVLPQKPTDMDYRYKVAHITIRSVADKVELDEVADYLPTNELIYKENDGTLWIKTSSGVKQISGSGSKDTSTGMTESEIIDLLVRMGIVAAKVTIKKDANGNDVKYYSDLTVNDICDVTFINEHSGKKFNITIDENGNIVSKELANDSSTIAQLIIDSSTSSIYKMSYEDHIRGLSSRYFGMESKKNVLVNGIVDTTSQAGVTDLNSDRVKIGSYYAPLSTDNVFGCSHAYIELENTSDKDFILDGCYLHWMKPNFLTGSVEVLHHELNGILRAGSTYLIRGKQYADPSLSDNVYVTVSDYDDEWYVGDASTGYELIDLTIDKETNPDIACYGIALTFGVSDITPDTSTNKANDLSEYSALLSTYPYIWKWWYIDSLAINKQYSDSPNCRWTPCDVNNVISANSNTIVKGTFELDPAKQAFQGLNMKDSSRVRGAKYSNDVQYVSLTNKYISFPNSNDVYPVSKFTPKSSKQKKNVCTDKSKLDLEKPNMVTCSFGMDGFTTRCFNWISAGSYDEYVWLVDASTQTWTKFESYKHTDSTIAPSTTYPRRKEYDMVINNAVYARMYSSFPADGTKFTSHKCVVEVLETNNLTAPKTYYYAIGREILDHSTGMYIIDEEHASDVYSFTIYPKSYTPRIYQITDQQGFHWIEYQVWSAAAKKLNEKIIADASAENIIPVLINTGDMTQNGTRINEWLDYYNGGKSLFSHLEQMNVVGNNDLCGTTPTVLGTGDDTGKSNSYYFHLFYCYDVFSMIDTSYSSTDERYYVRPLIKGSDYVYRYVPSLYYFDLGNYRFMMVNSEITETNCKDWFKKTIENQLTPTSEITKYTVNVYTGWQVIPNVSLTEDPYTTIQNAAYDNTFTTIYTMLYNILNNAKSSNLKVIAACHEMPFTVITNSELKTNQGDSTNITQSRYRSLNSSNSLIGSHLNQISKNDLCSIYWFSRLLESFDVTLCIGGHKHTYACTYPVRENYISYDSSADRLADTNPKYSYNEPMVMTKTLENDTWKCKWYVDWTISSGSGSTTYHLNLTKLPLLSRTPRGIDSSAVVEYTDSSVSDFYTIAADKAYFPVCASRTFSDSSYDGVTYFMCQATGYKLTSNKELPTQKQCFSCLIPKTTIKNGSDSPDKSQKYPMFSMTTFSSSGTDDVDSSTYLLRFQNILNSDNGFTQSSYGTGTPYTQYAYQEADASTNFCLWTTDATTPKVIISTKIKKLHA